MNEIEKLKQENADLRKQLLEKEEQQKDKAKLLFKGLKGLGKVFAGKPLSKSLDLFLQELSENKKVSRETTANLLASIFNRITRIGLITIILTLIPSSFIIIQTILLSRQNELINIQNFRVEQQTYLQEAERRSSLVYLFSNIMDQMDKELKEDYNIDGIRNLSPQLIGRIISLSERLKPYRFFEDGNLTEKPFSPERAQLFINIVKSKLNQETINSILSEGNFTYSDFLYPSRIGMGVHRSSTHCSEI